MIPLTLNDIFLSVVDRGERVVMMHRQETGWASISSQELYRRVTGVARALQGWGIAPGDRVAILGENRPEWTIADLAVLLFGAVTVPLYPTLTAEQTAYVLRDSGARAIFVSNETHLQKVLGIRSQSPMEHIVIMDASKSEAASSMELLMQQGGEASDPKLEERARGVRPSDLATIIYTSGTTGVPKGAMLTHGNMASNLACSLHGFSLQPGGLSVSFLPLSHVTARHLDFTMLLHGVVLAYVPHPDQLPRALIEMRPTIFVGVPRVYEKIFAQVDLKARGLKRGIYRWALAVGRAQRAEIMEGKRPQSAAWKLADRLLFSKVRAGMGGRVELFISGGAPLGRELAEWYADIGIRIHEGYGLTETSPVIALNSPVAHKLGTVGKPLANVEVRIAEDGEILVRGPSIFQSYWNRPQETKDAFVDGWFKTGDIGKLDSDGFLSVTDRKKDLIKTSGGKFIAPQPLENSLKHNPLIAEAVVVGEKRKFPAVLIAPCFSVLQEWAKANNLSCRSRDELVDHSRVQALYESIVEEMNQSLAQFEKLKRVLLIADELSTANGMLTASLKLRRREVTEKYCERIEKMYAEAESSESR
jgi:long-chain acyl-CoA synthetase